MPQVAHEVEDHALGAEDLPGGATEMRATMEPLATSSFLARLCHV